MRWFKLRKLKAISKENGNSKPPAILLAICLARYQGESNALWHQFPHDTHTGVSGYICRYTQLIDGWRSALDFTARAGWLTVQLAPVLEDHTQSAFPGIRLAQQMVGDASFPGDVATVVIQDLGDPCPDSQKGRMPPACVGSVGSMHPRDKSAVGARLASAALALGFIGQAPPAADATSWGGPVFGSVTRDGPATFTVSLGRAAGLRAVGSRGCANVTAFDDGANRSHAERCCDAPDTFQLWPSFNATLQAAPWTAASRPTGVACMIVGAALECTTPAPIQRGQVWTFAWQNFPPCMLANTAQLPASPMRAVVPAQTA